MSLAITSSKSGQSWLAPSERWEEGGLVKSGLSRLQSSKPPGIPGDRPKVELDTTNNSETLRQTILKATDLTEVLSAMATDGHPVTPDLVACTSPYMRELIRRFGRFALDMNDLPNPLNPPATAV
jgi:hypothetical protein